MRAQQDAATPYNPRSFDLGLVHVETWEADEHRLAHYLIFRVNGDDGSRRLLPSGSDHDLASCLKKAEVAARLAGLPQ